MPTKKIFNENISQKLTNEHFPHYAYSNIYVHCGMGFLPVLAAGFLGKNPSRLRGSRGFCSRGGRGTTGWPLSLKTGERAPEEGHPSPSPPSPAPVPTPSRLRGSDSLPRSLIFITWFATALLLMDICRFRGRFSPFSPPPPPPSSRTTSSADFFSAAFASFDRRRLLFWALRLGPGFAATAGPDAATGCAFE